MTVFCNKVFLIYLSDKPIEFNNGNRLVENEREVLIDLSFFAPAAKNYEGYYPLITEKGIHEDDNSYLTGTIATFGITPSTTDENFDFNFEERKFIWENGSATITTVNGKLNINFSLENNQYLIEGEFKENLIDVSSN